VLMCTQKCLAIHFEVKNVKISAKITSQLLAPGPNDAVDGVADRYANRGIVRSSA
jgi:hypothetical protein